MDRGILNRIMADTARVAVLICAAMGELDVEEDAKRAEVRLPIGLPSGVTRDWAAEYLDDDAADLMDGGTVTYRLELVEDDE